MVLSVIYLRIRRILIVLVNRGLARKLLLLLLLLIGRKEKLVAGCTLLDTLASR